MRKIIAPPNRDSLDGARGDEGAEHAHRDQKDDAVAYGDLPYLLERPIMAGPIAPPAHHSAMARRGPRLVRWMPASTLRGMATGDAIVAVE